MSHVVSENNFLKIVFDYKCMEINDPWGMANLVSRGMVGRPTRYYLILNIFTAGPLSCSKFIEGTWPIWTPEAWLAGFL